MKKKILITGIGGEIGQGISLLIKKYFPSFEISGTDYHKRHSGKLFVKKFYLDYYKIKNFGKHQN